jgi:hypothetical protein
MIKILSRKNLIRFFVFALIAAALVAAFTFGENYRQAQAQSGGPDTGSGAPSAVDAGPFGCTISNIAVFSGRIHVFCSSAPSGTTIRYFAASGDKAHELATNRFLVMLNTAYSLGKPVYIYYLADPASNPSGCGSNDCRAIDWMFIVP